MRLLLLFFLPSILSYGIGKSLVEGEVNCLILLTRVNNLSGGLMIQSVYLGGIFFVACEYQCRSKMLLN